MANASAFDPVAHPEAATRRRNIVLAAMFTRHRLGQLEYFNARHERCRGTCNRRRSRRRATFATWVRQQLVDARAASRVRGRVKVYASLDEDLQNAARKAINQNLANPAGPSAALVAIDNATGQVRAMIGGRDTTRRPSTWRRQGQRQPGSSFKPFILATALKAGIGPGSVWPSRNASSACPTRPANFTVNNSRAPTRGRRRWRAA